jgi:DNA-directed RNA polymerase subunit L
MAMEIKIIEDAKDRILMEVSGEDHTFCNILVKKLNESKDVKFAAYSIDHPLVGIPKLLVEGKDARGLLKKAIKELSGESEEIKKLSVSL